MTPFLKFRPIYQDRVWGGRGLEGFLKRSLPGTTPIGESWEIVDRPEAQSVVLEGAWAGLTLRQLIEKHAPEVMGATWPREKAFPLLVKWLDCRERLSLQVHPPASVAGKLGGEPKTENWYVAHAEPTAAVLAGLKPGVDSAQFRAAIANNTAEQLVYRMPTRSGDSLLIRSGVMHAIDGGNIILEIQQNSDTTYRVYDWGRMGLDGKPRAMHVEQSMVSLKANTAPTPTLVKNSSENGVLAECDEFRITRCVIAAGKTLQFSPSTECRLVSVVGGRLDGADTRISLGDNLLLPCGRDIALTAAEPSVVLVTDRFSALEKGKR